MARQGYGDRIKRAILTRQSQIGKELTYEEVGIATAKAEKRREPYSLQAVGAWIAERNEPTLKTFTALAKVLNTTDAWLAFGVPPADAGQVERDQAKDRRA